MHGTVAWWVALFQGRIDVYRTGLDNWPTARPLTARQQVGVTVPSVSLSVCFGALAS